MVAPHSGVWMIEGSYDQEVSRYFIVEQNEYLSTMLRDNAHKYLKGSLLAVVIFSYVINIGPVVNRYVVEYGSDIGALSLTGMCRRAAAPVLPTLAGTNTTVERLNRIKISSRDIHI